MQSENLIAPDGHSITTFEWCPNATQPEILIQVLHGLGEHAGRYQRFAAACNAERIAVVAHNHRGHGNLDAAGHYADRDGWAKVISDVLQVRQHIAERFPKAPVVLLGHSMGSYIAQSFVIRHGGNNVAAPGRPQSQFSCKQYDAARLSLERLMDKNPDFRCSFCR